jgi:hypothetical protein
MDLFNWFIAPTFVLNPINFWPAMGLTLVVTVLTGGYKIEGMEWDDVDKFWINPLGICLFFGLAWLFGLFYSSMI